LSLLPRFDPIEGVDYGLVNEPRGDYTRLQNTDLPFLLIKVRDEEVCQSFYIAPRYDRPGQLKEKINRRLKSRMRRNAMKSGGGED